MQRSKLWLETDPQRTEMLLRLEICPTQDVQRILERSSAKKVNSLTQLMRATSRYQNSWKMISSSSIWGIKVVKIKWSTKKNSKLHVLAKSETAPTTSWLERSNLDLKQATSSTNVIWPKRSSRTWAYKMRTISSFRICCWLWVTYNWKARLSLISLEIIMKPSSIRSTRPKTKIEG